MQNSSFWTRLTKGIQARAGSLFSNPYRKVNISWLDEKFYKHLSSGKIRSHTLFGKKFFFYSPQEFLHGLKELFIEELYSQELGKCPFIIDCGANMGLSIIYMKQLYPDAGILAFEPDETNFDLLSKNMQSFGYEDVTLRKEAVWKENTTLRFSNEGSMSSKITDQHTALTREVAAVRLKELLTRQVDFLKMDIEGAEFEVMMDIADKLTLVKNLFIEYHGVFGQEKELNTLLTMLVDKGFHYYVKEATSVYDHPFRREKNPVIPYDIQLNIFCFR